MKVSIAHLFLLGTTSSTALAQGLVTFENSSETLVRIEATGAPATPDQVVVGLYWRPDAVSEWSLVEPTATLVAPGIFVGGSRIIQEVYFGTVDLQVRAWSSGYPDYETAVATGSPQVLEGVSNIMSVFVDPQHPAHLVGHGGLQSFGVRPVPEPSSFMFLILGLASLWRLRQRNAATDSPC